MPIFTGPRRDASFWLKLALVLALVVLGDVVFWQWDQVAGVQGLFALGLCAALLAARPAVRRDRRALVALGFAALYALAQLWDPGPLAFVLFWIAIGMATLLPSVARFGDGWTWFQRLWVHGFKSLIGPLIDLVIVARVRRRRPPAPWGVRSALKTLVLPLLGTALFLALFAEANPVIEALVAQLSLPEFDMSQLPRLVLWALFALFGWGVLRARPPRRLFGTADASGDPALPGFSLQSVSLSLIMFNALFAVQNAMDLAYLSGVATLPKGITLADYAHRGAYPLVVTALLAALFVLATSRPESSTAQSPRVRQLVTLWIAQNLVLVASAAWRTWSYVAVYSLTELRLAALLWMALVAAGLVLVLWRMLKAKRLGWLINANLAAAGLLLTGVCFTDLGAVAASWNVRHSREVGGEGARLDLCYLDSLQASALPALAELDARRLPGAFGQQVSALHRRHHAALEQRQGHEGWTLLGGYRLSRDPLQPSAPNAPELGVPCDDYALRD